jgi:hypothetical protein
MRFMYGIAGNKGTRIIIGDTSSDSRQKDILVQESVSF